VIAALYVQTNGVYYGLPDVDPWDEARDARLYAGPWPVVAHPPCNRWSRLATFRRQRDGQDGGCFAHALAAVRRFGGVLEHPAHSLAWSRFALMRPPERGWGRSLYDDGWVCAVDQRLYGHEARKPTWLYVHGIADPPAMLWGKSSRTSRTIQSSYGGKVSAVRNSATPEPFRDALLEMARSALPSFDILPSASVV
jgi:hypothetical protein